jgi:hypothetical protein
MTSHKTRVLLGILATTAVGAALYIASTPASLPAVEAQSPNAATAFDIALIGDTRYTAEQQAKFPNLLDDINANKVEFVVHDGDIKGGSDECVDEVYTETRDLFNQFEAPLIYTPGDNEWTDCHRFPGDFDDPIERLAFLREVFYPNEDSLGEDTLELDRQSEDFPENARWQYGNVTFATVHIVGSNNNLGRTPEADAEYAARNAANLEWIEATFDQAEAEGSIGVMVIIQANMFEDNNSDPSGFDETLALLQSESVAFGKPVMLVHGDSHFFRMDKPFLTPELSHLENFTRLETFGTEDVHWVRVTIDPKYDEVFLVRQEVVDANIDEHALP